MAWAFRWFVFLALVGLAVFWWISRPSFVDETEIAGLIGDPIAGELVFNAGGCASCHAAPGAEGDAKLILAGGLEFHTEFGTFVAPNISPSPEGIGDWNTYDLANAMIKGVSPDGAHYYPAFPYVSYAKARFQDVADLKAYMDGLPADATPNRSHDVSFPFNIRRLLGGWKFLFARSDFVLDAADDPQLERGRYLVEVLGHCAECHTGRNILGGSRMGAWMAGGPNPDGKGNIPNVTPHESGIAAWSNDEIVEYLTSGFTPEFDVAGGSMTDVIANTAKLPIEDRKAIAAYLKALPALPSGY